MRVHDEVCGMTILAEEAVATAEFQGKTYHFCSTRCEQNFLAHPSWYVEVNPEMEGRGATETKGDAHH